jgi:hypothetical protein
LQSCPLWRTDEWGEPGIAERHALVDNKPENHGMKREAKHSNVGVACFIDRDH